MINILGAMDPSEQVKITATIRST